MSHVLGCKCHVPMSLIPLSIVFVEVYVVLARSGHGQQCVWCVRLPFIRSRMHVKNPDNAFVDYNMVLNTIEGLVTT